MRIRGPAITRQQNVDGRDTDVVGSGPGDVEETIHIPCLTTVGHRHRNFRRFGIARGHRGRSLIGKIVMFGHRHIHRTRRCRIGAEGHNPRRICLINQMDLIALPETDRRIRHRTSTGSYRHGKRRNAGRKCRVVCRNQTRRRLGPDRHLGVAQQSDLVESIPHVVVDLRVRHIIVLCIGMGHTQVVKIACKEGSEELLVIKVGYTLAGIPGTSPSIAAVPDKGYTTAIRVVYPVFGDRVIVDCGRPATAGVEDPKLRGIAEIIEIIVIEGAGADRQNRDIGVPVMVDYRLPCIQCVHGTRVVEISARLVELGYRIVTRRHIVVIDHVLGYPAIGVRARPQYLSQEQHVLQVTSRKAGAPTVAPLIYQNPVDEIRDL